MGRDKKNKNNQNELEMKQEHLTEKPENLKETENSENSENMEDKTGASEKPEEEKNSDASEKPEEEKNSDASEKPEEEKKTTASDKSDTDEKTDTESKSEKEEMKTGDKSELYEKEPFIDPSVYAHRHKKRVQRTVIISVVAFVLAVYFGGVLFHLNRFGTMTTVNGMNVSGKSVAQVEKMLLDDASSYELSVKYKGEVLKIALGDADSKAELTQSVKSVVRKNSPFLWFVDAFKSYDYKIPYTVLCDRTMLAKFMSTCKSMDVNQMVDPTDAKVVMEDGEVIVIPDETGTKLDVEKVYDKILYAMKSFEQELDVEKEGCYVEAHITTESDSILRAREEAEDFLSIEACFDFGDYTYQIPKEELTKIAYVSEDGSVQISQNNVAAYAQKFAQQFSTSYTDRVFKTHDGKKILVYGGYYGWVLDPEAESEELYELLCQKRSFTKEPVCEKRGYTMCEENDIGYTYVEVDLTNQHVYFYKNGRLKWDSDCVTGQTPGHKTPGGLYDITYKKLHATLIGEDYETPVTYWMPFNRGIGLHDANWRREFGDDIYTYYGSHGCVNLPVDKAAELFELVEEGMPVVCYWRDEVREVKD